MSSFGLVGALLLGALGFWLHSRRNRAGIVLLGLAAVCAVVPNLWLYLQRERGSQVPVTARNFSILGWVMGEWAQEALGTQRGTVLFLLPPESVMPRAARLSAQAAFLDNFREDRPVSREVVVAGPAAGATLQVTGAAEFERALGTLGGVAIVVSFVGIPEKFETSAFAGKTPRPLLFAYEPNPGGHWLAAVKAGIVQRMVLPKPGVDPAKFSAVGPPQEVFPELYLSVTAENADEIASRTRGK